MKSTVFTTTLVFLIVFNSARSQNIDQFFSKADTFFNTYVKNDRVDYEGIKTDSSSLNELIALGKTISVSKNDAKTYQAFWINGYNLHVIKGIVDNYPVKSPLDIKGFFDKEMREIGGKQITLNDIENELLRGNFPKEARFHFVLVCAGLGCPPIINEAYSPETLETQLQKQTVLSLNNPGFIKAKGNKVLLSQIFEWYKGDFTQDGKTELEFINQYRKEKLDSNAKVGYYPYDWSLNKA